MFETIDTKKSLRQQRDLLLQQNEELAHKLAHAKNNYARAPLPTIKLGVQVPLCEDLDPEIVRRLAGQDLLDKLQDYILYEELSSCGVSRGTLLASLTVVAERGCKL